MSMGDGGPLGTFHRFRPRWLEELPPGTWVVLRIADDMHIVRCCVHVPREPDYFVDNDGRWMPCKSIVDVIPNHDPDPLV